MPTNDYEAARQAEDARKRASDADRKMLIEKFYDKLMPRLVGVDMARPGGDLSAEVEFEQMPGGALRVTSARTF